MLTGYHGSLILGPQIIRQETNFVSSVVMQGRIFSVPISIHVKCLQGTVLQMNSFPTCGGEKGQSNILHFD